MPTLTDTPQTVTPSSSATPKIVSFEEVESTEEGSFENYQCYTTHDNGGMSFVIQVSNDKKHVNIYESAMTRKARSETSKCMIQQEIQLEDGQQIIKKGIYCYDPIDKQAYFFAFIKSLKYDETPFEVFIGIDNTAQVYPTCAMYQDVYHGASVLIRFKPSNECWFFGIYIAKFTINENIEALYCPVGNNDVVYPYLVSETKCYIFEEALISIDKDLVMNAPSQIMDHWWSKGTTLWSKSEFTSCSPRQTDKNYHQNPTIPVNVL